MPFPRCFLFADSSSCSGDQKCRAVPPLDAIIEAKRDIL